MQQTPNNQVQSPYIPSEAYLYFPKIDNSKYPEIQRVFFDGNTQFTFYEQEMIKNFRSYCTKENYTLKPLWTDNMILRFLYSNNFKMNKTLSSAKDHTNWREAKLPIHIDKPLEEFLNSGILYVHGRDQEFRPILVFNFHLVNPKKINLELFSRAFIFMYEHVINEWLLPGQVENWVVLSDLKNMSLSAVREIKPVLMYLRENYKGRLSKLYLINVPPCLYVLYEGIKKKLTNDPLVKKAQIYKGPIPIDLLKSTNKEQLQEKHGGAAKNLTQYWPPVITSNNYFVNPKDSETLISEEKYVSLYRSGTLTGMRVDQGRISLNSTSNSEGTDAKTQPVSSNTPGGNHSDDLDNPEDDISADMGDVSEMIEDNQIEMVVREFQQFLIESSNSSNSSDEK